jgi:hypothetical protein
MQPTSPGICQAGEGNRKRGQQGGPDRHLLLSVHISGAILQSLGQMTRTDRLTPRQIRNCTGKLQDAVVGSGRAVWHALHAL